MLNTKGSVATLKWRVVQESDNHDQYMGQNLLTSGPWWTSQTPTSGPPWLLHYVIYLQSDSVSGEEHGDSKDETEKKVKAGVGQLGTDGLDVYLRDGNQTLDASKPVPVSTTGLIPIVGRANDRMLEANSKLVHLSTICPLGDGNPGTNLKAIDELSERNVATVTERRQSLEVVGIGTVPELDPDEVPIVWSQTGTEFDGDGGSVIGHTLEFRMSLHDVGHVEE